MGLTALVSSSTNLAEILGGNCCGVGRDAVREESFRGRLSFGTRNFGH